MYKKSTLYLGSENFKNISDIQDEKTYKLSQTNILQYFLKEFKTNKY